MMASINKGTIFMTGATGHVGSAVAIAAINDGYQVRGLSRSEKGDEKLKSLGVYPVRGDLHALDVLRGEAAKADVIMHLADSFLDHSTPKTYEEAISIECAAVDALATPLTGTTKPLLVTSGCLVVGPDDGKETNEDSPLDPAPFVERIRSERHAMAWAERGVRIVCIRLAPWVYGYGRSGVYLFLNMAMKSKQAVYLGDGHWPTSTVHVDDAARLYLLAAEKAGAGDIFNATSQTDLTMKQLMEAIGATCGVPATSVMEEQANSIMPSFFVKFISSECRASSAKARTQLGWSPQGASLLDELARGSYQQLAERIKAQSS